LYGFEKFAPNNTKIYKEDRKLGFLDKLRKPVTEETSAVEEVITNGILNHNLTDQILTVYLSGKIDADDYEDIQKTVISLAEENDIKSIIFNMDNVTYVSSAGLRMFSAINQYAEEKQYVYKLVEMQNAILKMFQMTGYANAFQIEVKED